MTASVDTEEYVVHILLMVKKKKFDVPLLFPWDNSQKKPPLARQLFSQRVSSNYVPLTVRREIVDHDHCYCLPNTTSAYGTDGVQGGSALLSAPFAQTGTVQLLCDASLNRVHQEYVCPFCDNNQRQTVNHASSQTDVNLVSPFVVEHIADNKELVRFYTGFEDYDTDDLLHFPGFLCTEITLLGY